MQNEIGALIVTYARGEQALSLVSTAISAGVKTIFIWIDGPKNAEIFQIQENFILNLRGVKLKNSEITFIVLRSKKNFGAAASILSACDLVFSRVSKAVILEDDLQVDEEFFRVVANGITLSEPYPDVWMVSGSRILASGQAEEWETMNYPVGWGWGTTSEKWNLMIHSLSDSGELRKIKKLRNRGFWRTGYTRAVTGFTDAWDTPLAAIMAALDKRCFIPPVNLVTNHGFDSFATHTLKPEWPLGMERKNLQGDIASYINWDTIKSNNEYYEREIFRIRVHHSFAPIYDALVRIARIKKSKNLMPLFQRVMMASDSVLEIKL